MSLSLMFMFVVYMQFTLREYHCRTHNAQNANTNQYTHMAQISNSSLKCSPQLEWFVSYQIPKYTQYTSI